MKSSESQQESSAAKFYSGQVVTTSEQSTNESHTRAFHSYQAATKLQVSVSNSSQTSPHVRSRPAGLVNNPRLRTNSGKQDGRDFNNQGGERGRQPISFRSCEHTDQKAAQVAIAPPGQLSDVKKLRIILPESAKAATASYPVE